MAMLDWQTCPAVERDPQKVSGAWVFRDTRVPVSALFENIEGGATVDQFLQWFPGTTREQVDACSSTQRAAFRPRETGSGCESCSIRVRQSR
jgi:uncharacterized protein (DUF433 family)